MNFQGKIADINKLLRPLRWVAGTVVLAVVAVVIAYLYSAQSSPSGKRIINALGDTVVIAFDETGIPHIKAKSQTDALFALGYLHATERSWQLEMNRRIACGRLSETLGPDTVDIDRFIRTLGVKRAAEKQFDKYPVAAKRLLQAYADGVNAGNTNLGWALPIEYFLTGSKPGHWSPTDSVAWMLMMAYDLGGNWQKELQRLELSQYLSTKEIWEVMPSFEPNGEPLTTMDFAKLYKDHGVFSAQSGPANSKSKNLPATELTRVNLPGGKEGIGSNNWALSGKLTDTGKPLLANDPHLGLSAPAVWYFAHLDAPGMNVIGGTLPGIPAVVLGRTEKFAWSFTNTNPDVQDTYLEQLDVNNPGMYRGPNGMLPFTVRQEIIDIKGSSPLTFLVKETRHGPVISDAYARAKRLIDTDRYALALRWTALDHENQSVVGLLEMNRANDLESFKAALNKNYAPMQNVVMADAEGNISYQAAGVAPKRVLHQGLYGVAPAFGWDKQYDWSGYVPFDHLPASNNPDQGWIATANQRIIAANDPNPLTGDWDLSARYDRIVQLIKSKETHSFADMKTMQADTLSVSSLPLLELFKSSKSNHPLADQAMAIAKDFNGDMKVDSSAALIFNAWADQLTRNIFSRLGYIFTQTYGDKNYRGATLGLLKNPESPWCDNPKTQSVESCQDSANDALDKALDYLAKQYGKEPQKWAWGQAHIAISEHRPLSKVPLIGKLFNISTPFPGDSNTINVGRLELLRSENPYETIQGPSLRTIYDLSDLEKSVFIYQAGQSGWVQSPWYRNMSSMWAKNEYLPMQMKPEKISRTLELGNK